MIHSRFYANFKSIINNMYVICQTVKLALGAFFTEYTEY